MNELIPFENLSLRSYSKEILDLNEVSKEYGLVLSEEEAKELSETRNRAVTENDRIEIGMGILPEIMKMFCKSRYVNPENYAFVLNEVTYLFYYIKTETDDKIKDADLIKDLFERFELKCRGNIDILEGREAEMIIRKINSGKNYEKWYTYRDELINSDPLKSTDDNSPVSIINEVYDEKFFDTEDVADHDYYEKDVFDGLYEESESGFNFDVFDDFYNEKSMTDTTESTNSDAAVEELDEEGDSQNE